MRSPRCAKVLLTNKKGTPLKHNPYQPAFGNVLPAIERQLEITAADLALRAHLFQLFLNKLLFTRRKISVENNLLNQRKQTLVDASTCTPAVKSDSAIVLAYCIVRVSLL
jgi:hypothetical protein